MSQGDPFEMMAAVFATLDLVSAATEAVDHARELGLPRPAQVAAIVANVGFVDAWERAPDGARLDLLTIGTQAVVEAGVSAEDLSCLPKVLHVTEPRAAMIGWGGDRSRGRADLSGAWFRSMGRHA